jgi:monofunctional biosynthetic peptidoglycan transglycosylase
MRSLFRGIGKTFAAIGAVALATAGYVWVTLPDVRPLKSENPKTTAWMRMRAAEADRAGKPPQFSQQWVSYSKISPSLKRAVMVAEDASFLQHDGVDYDELRAAIELDWNRGEFVRGASTITQQLAKNLYLSPSRNPYRKLAELFITRRLEVELTKGRIFELYLNVIEWGDGIWGADAAARTYFHKSASDLSAAESALLSAAISNPHIFNPAHPSARLHRRQQMVMQRMGAVTPPPVVAGPPIPTTPDIGDVQPVPEVPPEDPPPVALPGAPMAIPKGPGGKPPGGL